MNAMEKKPARLTDKAADATDVVTHDVEPLEVNVDSGKYTRMGWIIVLAGVIGFLIWALTAPLDKGVPLSGTVAAEGNRKSIQHQTGGLIEEILVRDGDVVKSGQVLVRINPIMAKSAAEMTRGQYFNSQATEARLTAEQAGKTTLALPATLKPYKDDPRVIEAMAVQSQLMASRQGALNNELSALQQSIAGLKAQAQGLQESRDSKKIQADTLKEQLQGMRDLSRDGYVPRAKLLELERTYAGIQGTISEDIGNIGRIQSQITEATLKSLQRKQEYQKEVANLLSEAQKEGRALSSRIVAQDFELQSNELRSPVDGVVVGSAIFTKGGVVQAGFKMMDIVPSSDTLVVEGQLAVNLIDKVHVGLPVEFIFSAFNTNKTPHIPGVITQVSADRTVDERTGNPYYKIKARVTPEGAKLVAGHKLDLQAGMPVELFVKTGERTMANYLLKPVFDRAKTSMSED